MKELRNFTEKAEKFLTTAEHALNIGDYDSSVSRSYYAMFFMGEAALLTKNLSSSSHKGVISLFGEHFVKTGVFDRGTGKAFNDAYDKRLVGDYGIGFIVSEKEARYLLETAQSFVRELKLYLERYGDSQI